MLGFYAVLHCCSCLQISAVSAVNNLKRVAMDELEATACHLDNLREMIAVMKDAAITDFVMVLRRLLGEFVREAEEVYDVKLTGLNGLEKDIVGSLVIDPEKFFTSPMVRSLLTFRCQPIKTVTSSCLGSVISSEVSVDDLKFVENYHMKMYEEGSRVIIYYLCESEHDPLLIKFIKVSVRDEGGKDVIASHHDFMDGMYMITFAANVPGVYEVHVTLSNQHVTGSPLNILVQGARSTVPKASLMMNVLEAGNTIVRHGRLAVGGTGFAGASSAAIFCESMQALTKGCSIPSDTSKNRREHVCLPETDNQGESGDSLFLHSLLRFMVDSKQPSELLRCAESVTKATARKTRVQLGSDAACMESSVLKRHKFNLKTSSTAARALMPAPVHNLLNVKTDSSVAHQHKPTPWHGMSNIKADSSASHALTSASEHECSNISVAHQQKPTSGHDKFNIKTDRSAARALTPACWHDSLNVNIDSRAAHREKSAPKHDTLNFKVDSHAAAPRTPASKHDQLNAKVGNGMTESKTSPVKNVNMGVKRHSGQELVSSDSVRQDSSKSLQLASERAVSIKNVENTSAGASKQSCKPAALPRTAGSILARLVLKLDSYKSNRFSYPTGITATSQGNIIICDTRNDRVFTFNPEGRPLHEAINGSKRTFCRPSAVVAMEDGTYAVKDDFCIYVFSKHGELIRTLGRGSLRRPYGLALYGTENLMTLSVGGSVPTLGCFSASGNFEQSVVYGPLARGVPPGSKCRFMDIHKGAIFVADLGLSRVYKTDMEGQPVATFGTKGKGRGQMIEPSGVSGTEHLLFIGDSKNNRVQVFDYEGKFITVVKAASGPVRPSGVYVSPVNKLYALSYLHGAAGIYSLSYDSDS